MKGMFSTGYSDYVSNTPKVTGIQDVPVNNWQATQAAYDLFVNEDRSDSLSDPFQAAMDERRDAFKNSDIDAPSAIFGVFEDPYDHYTELMVDEELYGKMADGRKAAGGTNWREGAKNVDQVLRMKHKYKWDAYNQVQDILEANPDKFPNDQQIRDKVIAEKLQKSKQSEAVLARSDSVLAPIAGSMAAAVTDPVNMASMLMGGGGWAKGASILTNVLRTGATEALVGSASEAFIQQDVIKTKQAMGKEYGWSDAGKNVAIAGAGSFVLGLGLGAGASTAGDLISKLRKGKAKIEADIENGFAQHTDDTDMALHQADAMIRVMERSDPKASIEQLDADVERYLEEQIKMSTRANEFDIPFENLRTDYINEQVELAGSALTNKEAALIGKQIKTAKKAGNKELMDTLQAQLDANVVGRDAQLNLQRAEAGQLPDSELARYDEYKKDYDTTLAYAERSVAEEVAREVGYQKMSPTPKNVARQDKAKADLETAKQAREEPLEGVTAKPAKADGTGAVEPVTPKVAPLTTKQSVYKDYFSEADEAADDALFARLETLLKDEDMEGFEITSMDTNGNLTGKTVSAKKQARADDKEIKALNAIDMCMKGSQ